MNKKFYRIVTHRIFSILIILAASNSEMFTQEFSILTCSRGDQIYSTFGHSAFRFLDTSQGIDWVYNYGLFEFNDPNFIPKFCMGRLDYMVGKESMNDFMWQYVHQQREVKEQVLNLSPIQRDRLFKFLEWNILEENKFYRYDFLYNNCATKIVEVLEKNCGGVVMKFYEDKDPKSFRELIHINAKSAVPWIDWGMDVALGMPVDKKANPREYSFLPEFVASAMDLSTANGKPLVSSEHILIPKTERLVSDASSFFSPFNFALILVFSVLFLKFKPQSGSNRFFGIYFLLLGIGGLVIGFEWFFTEHSVTKNNLNLLWLNPLFIPYAYSIWKVKRWKVLNILLSGCIGLAFINAIFQFQDMHTASRCMIIASFFYLNVRFTSYGNKEV